MATGLLKSHQALSVYSGSGASSTTFWRGDGTWVNADSVVAGISSTGANTIGSAMGSTGANAILSSSSNGNLPGNPTAASKYIATSSANGTGPVRILWGALNSSGGITTGNGFTANRNTTGQYSITFSNPYSTTPSVVAIPIGGVALITVWSVSSTSVQIFTANIAFTAWIDMPFSFYAMGV